MRRHVVCVVIGTMSLRQADGPELRVDCGWTMARGRSCCPSLRAVGSDYWSFPICPSATLVHPGVLASWPSGPVVQWCSVPGTSGSSGFHWLTGLTGTSC